MFINKKARKSRPEDISSRSKGYAPHALPMYKEDSTNPKRKREKMRKNKILSKKPELPISGPGKGGRISGASTITSFLMKNLHEINKRTEDP